MRCDKDELLKRLEGMAARGSPIPRPAGAKRDMVDLDDLVVVPGGSLPDKATDTGTEVTIGTKRNSSHPITIGMPLYIADMSYGELGRTAKAALAYGAIVAKTMVMGGHGALLHEEREIVDELGGTVIAKWSRGRHGVDMSYLDFCHGVCIDLADGPQVLVPSEICTKEVAEAFGIPKGMEARQGRVHLDLGSEDDLKLHVDMLREALEHHVPVMVKVSGGEVYERTRVAIEAGADAVVLEGMQAWRARNTEATAEHAGEPLPGMLPPAIRAFLDTKARKHHVKLLVQGGILSGADAFKAMAMGADAVGLDCAALAGIGCRLLGMCHTNKCPQGIATIDPKLEAKVSCKQAGERLANLLRAMMDEMRAIAYHCGLDRVSSASMKNLRALTYNAAAITGVRLLGFDRPLPIWLQ